MNLVKKHKLIQDQLIGGLIRAQITMDDIEQCFRSLKTSKLVESRNFKVLKTQSPG